MRTKQNVIGAQRVADETELCVRGQRCASSWRSGGTYISLRDRTVWRFVKLRLSCRVNWMICVLVLVTGMSPVTRAADANNFAPLSEINTNNVARLKLVFYFRTGQSGGQSGAPAVAGDLLSDVGQH